jgi:hypothetical protein
VATGSEVSLAVEAAAKLKSSNGKRVRVVSMPSTTLFDRQPVAYRRQVLLPGVPVVSIECLGYALYFRHFLPFIDAVCVCVDMLCDMNDMVVCSKCVWLGAICSWSCGYDHVWCISTIKGCDEQIRFHS